MPKKKYPKNAKNNAGIDKKRKKIKKKKEKEIIEETDNIDYGRDKNKELISEQVTLSNKKDLDQKEIENFKNYRICQSIKKK